MDSVRKEIEDTGKAPNYVVMMHMNRNNRVIQWQGAIPHIVVMNRDQEIAQREQRLKALFPEMEFCTEIQPSPIDRMLHFLNPRGNINEQCEIFRVKMSDIK